MHPYGYDVYTDTHSHTQVVPRSAPTPPPAVRIYWRIGPVQAKLAAPPLPTGRPATAALLPESVITVQLTADQQVALSISGEDRYDNPVDITGATIWTSSDESIVVVTADDADPTKAVAVAVGPVGTAAVTVSNDVNSDGTGDFQGSLAIDVVAGQIAEIVIQEGAISDKPAE